MISKAQKIICIVNKFKEFEHRFTLPITNGFNFRFPLLWDYVSDKDIDFLLEDVDDIAFCRRLNEMFNKVTLLRTNKK